MRSILKLKFNLGLFFLLIFAVLVYFKNLSINGYSNDYYTAAVQAASVSWKSFLFGSLDAGNFITIDKPPIAVWFMALSVRLFGFSPFTMLLPNAIAGVITVLLIYFLVNIFFDSKSAFIAGLILLSTPIAALMFRFNNPDAFLTMFLTASSYTFLKSLNSKKPLFYLFLTAIWIGFAFNTKMIQGLILLPVMILIYLLFGNQKFFTRLMHLSIAFFVVSFTCLWWLIFISSTPANSRPYIGNSFNNSVWSLLLKYNGLDRFLGTKENVDLFKFTNYSFENENVKKLFDDLSISDIEHKCSNIGGIGFGGRPGVFRMFNPDFGPSIGWLIPLSLIGSVALLIKFSKLRNKLKMSVILFFTGWLILHIIIFSFARGTILSYYGVVMTPAIAVLLGVSFSVFWETYKKRRISLVFLLLIIMNALVSFKILDYNGILWLKYFIFIFTIISGLLLTISYFYPKNWIKYIAIISFLFSCLSSPMYYVLLTINREHSGYVPISGPVRVNAMNGQGFDIAKIDNRLIKYLSDNKDDEVWVTAVFSTYESAPIQINTGYPVMTLGGFNGIDRVLSLDDFKKYLLERKVRYYLLSTSGCSKSVLNKIFDSWVISNGKIVDYGSFDSGILYDLSSFNKSKL